MIKNLYADSKMNFLQSNQLLNRKDKKKKHILKKYCMKMSFTKRNNLKKKKNKDKKISKKQKNIPEWLKN